MRHLFKVCILLFISNAALAQDNLSEKWTGKWTGVLNVNEARLALMFKIDVKYAGWYTKLNIPQQGVKDFVISGTSIDKKNVRLQMDVLDASFDGKLIDSNTIKGFFHQHGQTFPLQLKRVWGDWPKPKPQAPRPPFSYVSENVKIPVANGRIMMAGTLTKPDTIGVFPTIVLISGSGPQDRNGTIGEHQPFLILADVFTKMGFAVFRYDDRGAGETKGHPEALKNTTTEDIARDVSLFVDFLKSRKDIDTGFIGLLGHSEGGMVAPMVAARRQDIAFIISLAGSAAGGLQANVYQNRYALEQAGFNERNIQSYLEIHRKILSIVLQYSDTATAHRAMDTVVKQWRKKAPKKSRLALFRDKKPNMHNVYSTYDAFQIPWWHFFLEYQPAKDLKKLQCPVLALNGSKDVQVPCDENLQAFKNNVPNSLLTMQCISGLNHLFQHCHQCTLPEYFTLDETFSPQAIEVMTAWLRELQASKK